MSDLSQDELTVLMIAREGNHLAPIGRWEKPVRDLAAKGMLVERDPVNFDITEAGRKASVEAEDEPFRQMIETGAKIRNAKIQAQQSVEVAARALIIAAKASMELLPDEFAVERWGKIAIERAKELLKNG